MSAVRALAACVRLAEEISPGQGPENDVYWETRENAVARGKELGLGIIPVVREIHSEDLRWLSKEGLRREAGDEWPRVCSGTLLVREVHGA